MFLSFEPNWRRNGLQVMNELQSTDYRTDMESRGNDPRKLQLFFRQPNRHNEYYMQPEGTSRYRESEVSIKGSDGSIPLIEAPGIR